MVSPGGVIYIAPKLDHSATFQTLLLLAVGMMHAQHRVAVIGLDCDNPRLLLPKINVRGAVIDCRARDKTL